MALAPISPGVTSLIGWAEPITASPGNAMPCLKKQEKNKQDRSMAAENLTSGAVAAK
jgi:hypothetical protein